VCAEKVPRQVPASCTADHWPRMMAAPESFSNRHVPDGAAPDVSLPLSAGTTPKQNTAAANSLDL
jgi:hypothetical protein